MHFPCDCSEPTRNCPRYGWMKGRKWEHCRGVNTTEEQREKYLDIYSGKAAPAEPSIIQKGINFLGSMISHAANGFVDASPEAQRERFDICAKCEHLNNDGKCNLCGCPAEDKTKLASAECPDNPPRWKKIGLEVISNPSPCCGS